MPGTRQGRTTVQLLPRYSRNHPTLLYLRGALQHMRRQAASVEVRKELSRADDALRKLGVSGALNAERLQRYDLSTDQLLRHEKLGQLRTWCQIAEHAIREHTFFRQLNKLSVSNLTDLLDAGRIEWFVHLPHLFERYVRRQLTIKLDKHPSLRGLEVTKPPGVPHKHFPDKMACPDVLVREKASRKAIAIYDVKLYRSAGDEPRRSDYHQVESDVLSFNAATGSNIAHAGLIYGFWHGGGVESGRWKRGCYHACVRGAPEDVEGEVKAGGVQAALGKLVEDLAAAVNAQTFCACLCL